MNHSLRRQPGALGGHIPQPVPEGAGARERLLQGRQGLEVLRARPQRGAHHRGADPRHLALPGTGQGSQAGPQEGTYDFASRERVTYFNNSHLPLCDKALVGDKRMT